jgi:hypothetical protein
MPEPNDPIFVIDDDIANQPFPGASTGIEGLYIPYSKKEYYATHAQPPPSEYIPKGQEKDPHYVSSWTKGGGFAYFPDLSKVPVWGTKGNSTTCYPDILYGTKVFAPSSREGWTYVGPTISGLENYNPPAGIEDRVKANINYFGSPKEYADAIKNKLAAGFQLSQPAEALEFALRNMSFFLIPNAPTAKP